jgi:hypothetical protein
MAATHNRIGWLTSIALVGLLALPVLSQTDNGGGGNNNNNQNNNAGGGGPGGGGPGGGGNNNNGGGGNNNGGGGGRGRFDPTQMRQRMMQRIQQALGASDDEFAVLEPKIDAVVQLRMDVNGGMFGRGMGRRPGGGGGGGGPDGGAPSTQPSSPVQTATADLRTTLDDDSATPDQIKSKLDTLRQAKAQEKADLSKNEDDLRSLLTQRQEAQLVLFGILD